MSELLNLNPKNSEKARPTSGATKESRLAAGLVTRMRLLFNQPALEVEALHVTGLTWSAELMAAGVPPSKWEEVFRMARQARPSAGKAFMVTVDQVIDAWGHYLAGDQWSIQEQAWRAYRPPIAYCGKCKQGEIPIEVTEKVYGQPRPRTVWKPCPCKIEHSARNSYHFRRFSAAYELRYGTPYEASESDLASLNKLKDEVDNLSWDTAAEEYFSSAENPTLRAFCAMWG